MTKRSEHFLTFTKSADDILIEIHSLNDDSTHGQRGMVLKALQVGC